MMMMDLLENAWLVGVEWLMWFWEDIVSTWILLEGVPHADLYLLILCLFLTATIFVQLRAFDRPQPVPLKRLPRKPTLQILFKPPHDDDVNVGKYAKNNKHPSNNRDNNQQDQQRQQQRRPSDVLRAFMSNSFFATTGAAAGENRDELNAQQRQRQQQQPIVDHHSDIPASVSVPSKLILDDEDENEDENEEEEDVPLHGATNTNDNKTLPPLVWEDLPDSFAPLLSSSRVEVVKNQLTMDLIHAVQAKATVILHDGRHEIPLNKDESRPQFVLDAPKGCRAAAWATVGSDGMSSDQDMDLSVPTTSRSHPMVKDAGVVLDPPLPLANVAPTLIHVPTLFRDNQLHRQYKSTKSSLLQQIQIVRILIDTLLFFSSFLEKLLWIVESKCQIHLSKVSIKPLYKGVKSQDAGTTPEWRLSLSFSGHALLFGWVPIPFIHVTLPTFLIPQPHALLEHLLSPEPLASATLRRENIAENKIVLAAIQAVRSWNTNVSAVATPPALGVDVTLPGGVALALEMSHGRDASTQPRRTATTATTPNNAQSSQDHPMESSISGSMSSWTTNMDNASVTRTYRNKSTSSMMMTTPAAASKLPLFDTNKLVPWLLEFSAKGSVSRDKMSVHIVKCSAEHEDETSLVSSSKFSTAGSLVVSKVDMLQQPRVSSSARSIASVATGTGSGGASSHTRRTGYGHMAALASTEDATSVAEILLFSEGKDKRRRLMHMLEYDYAFDVFETQIDAITLSVGASHPMLKDGAMVTIILEAIYALGSVAAREGAVMEPGEWKQKKNILRHLPAVDFTFGIQNAFIPPNSLSFTEDRSSRVIPEMEGGRIMIRLIGGVMEDTNGGDTTSNAFVTPVSNGIKMIADIGVESLTLRSESLVDEFPELDIFEDDRLYSLLSGTFTAKVSSHLRSQDVSTLSTTATMGPNLKNPLEAYEIDFSNSSVEFKIKESTTTLGHRRVIIPTETKFTVKVVESLVDMSMEGKTECELSWDFQGLSPILQVTEVGFSPADASHENKQQVSLLIAPLRQGRLNFNISAVGGIGIQKAVTSREDREGLYDWKFFNALVSPDQESAKRLLQVLRDKRTMDKMLQIIKLINTDIHRILRYILTQVWRAQEIFDQEGVSDPGHAIPKDMMARLISLFLCGDVSQVDAILPIIRRVTSGDGLDVVKVKDLLMQHVSQYEDWAPEIDRVLRWVAVMLGPMTAFQSYMDGEVPPLCEIPKHAMRFQQIPSARQLYDRIHDKPDLPLDITFSNLLGTVAPYLSFRQVEYFLQVRKPSDWQFSDLRRLRYVYSIKRKVLDISESYGGLSFLPQSFLVSVFLGEATRVSLRAPSRHSKRETTPSWPMNAGGFTTLSALRRRRMQAPNALRGIQEAHDEGYVETPAGRVASHQNFVEEKSFGASDKRIMLEHESRHSPHSMREEYELGDSLLGPQDVAILLQAGLTSPMKTSTVVQLNQRMLLDLIASQPRSFAVAVLAEIGTPGGQGAPRGLTSALMALLELEQESFTEVNRLDMHALLESWLPGFTIPRREDYMAGGRWARQSYYEAIYSVATNILEDAECYMALKSHLQRDRRNKESDPLPQPRETSSHAEVSDIGMDLADDGKRQSSSKLERVTENAKKKISTADELGAALVEKILKTENKAASHPEYEGVVKAYREAFDACAAVLACDKLAFQTEWFRRFYKRNYDALMLKSMHDNILEDVDEVRNWFVALERGAQDNNQTTTHDGKTAELFRHPQPEQEQAILDAIIDVTAYYEKDRESLKQDPLIRLLIPNPPGKYNFAVVSAMGVITEGVKGHELETAFERLTETRGVYVIRADTGTARSFEFNATKIGEAIQTVKKLGKPYGLLGYSQGCANILTAESHLLSGSPKQQELVDGLVCRQFLFSAGNGTVHGTASDKKVQRLIVMGEEFFKYQQGYVSRALTSTFLALLNSIMDSAPFHKLIGGAQSMLPDGCRAFWREGQHLPHVPSCSLRCVMEEHTTPESLEMISNLLTKQSGSSLHDSQVHVYDAVGYPVYTINRNGRLLRKCAVGDGYVQRSHHWSPLSDDEVGFLRTKRDVEQASFECAKDRHVFPWVDLNVRFGIVKYADKEF